jgi:hypothetical protein
MVVAAPVRFLRNKMRTRTEQRSGLAWAAVVVALLLALAVSGPAAIEPTGEKQHTTVPILPTRRAQDQPPAAPPALPLAADRVPAVTVSVSVSRTLASRRANVVERSISRTVDRVHIAEKGREWLFERNIRDPRRVSGSLIEHASQAIVSYEDSDLRMMLGIRGWSDVVALGFEIDLLSGYTRGAEVRTIDGVRFQKYSANHKAATVRELWWNEEQLLATAFTLDDPAGSMRVSISRIRHSVDPALLRLPEARFPGYRAFNLADWLEHR